MHTLSDISVLGMGNMGVACVRALLRRHRRVTVWNRTASKAEALVKEGATAALTAAEAISSSPLSVMAVLDHSAAFSILQDPQVAQALAGGTLLQTTTGSPDDLRKQCDLVVQQHGRFLGGVIFTFPRSIGQLHAVGVCAGDAGAFEEHRNILHGIAHFQYLGSDVGSAVGAYMTLGTMMMGTMALFYETTAVARHFGLSMDTYFLLNKLTWEETWDAIRDGALRIATGEFDGSQAPVGQILAGMPDLMAALRQSRVSVRIAEAMIAQLELTRSSGGPGKEMAYMTEALWNERCARAPERDE